MGIIVWNGVRSTDVGVVVEHPPKYSIPEHDYTVVHVPGRSGDVIFDTGSFKNVPQDYDIAFGSLTKHHSEMARAVSEWLASPSGYVRLEDSYMPDYYRMAKFSAQTDFENLLNHMGRATITFDCKPQKFLKSGEQSTSTDFRPWVGNYTFSPSIILKNPTKFDAKPVFKIDIGELESYNAIHGRLVVLNLDTTPQRSYTIQLLVNDRLGNTGRYIAIDTELQEAYFTDESGDEILAFATVAIESLTPEGEFPVLAPGRNQITLYTSEYPFTKLEVTPRWWTL